jgi:type II secretory pathway pseudopilin PulG
MILAAHVYDPDAEEGRRHTGHFTKKDLKVILVIVAILLVLLLPVYKLLKRQRDNHLCTQNLVAIGTAMDLYANDNNDRFPPIYVTAENTPAPMVFKDGSVFTWVSLLSRYMSARASFVCPAAEDAENVKNENGDSSPGKPRTIGSSYGMYGALSAFPRASIPTLSSTALVCDTANDGAADSYDPMPLTDQNGKVLPDGFMVGLDNYNFPPEAFPSRKVFGSSTLPTRLAYPGTKKGSFEPKGDSRHLGGIHFLMADLHLKTIAPDGAIVTRTGKKGEIRGLWAVP